MQDDAAFTTISGTPAEAGRPATLVLGATGGTGVRIVRRLLARGERVRALVRNPEKARREFGKLPVGSGGVLEVAAADLSQPATVVPELLEDVRQAISCTGTVVRPQEGDDAERSKCGSPPPLTPPPHPPPPKHHPTYPLTAHH